MARRRASGKRSRTCAIQLCLGVAGVGALRTQARADDVSVSECVATRACTDVTYYGIPARIPDLRDSLSSLINATRECECVRDELRDVGTDGITTMGDVRLDVLMHDLQETYEMVRNEVGVDVTRREMHDDGYTDTEGSRTIVVRLSALEEATLRDIATCVDLTPSAWVYVSCTPLAPDYRPFDVDMGVSLLDELSNQARLLDELASSIGSVTFSMASRQADALRLVVSERLLHRVVTIV